MRIFASTVVVLAIFRVILGLGMGGEWTAGAALVAETWPAQHRGKALGLMQSTWAIGEILAALVALAILPHCGWRGVFFVGVLPALVALWIQRRVPEPEIWKRRETVCGAPRVPLRVLWRKDIRWNGLLATAMNTFSMLGYWGLFTWIPAYLSLPVSQGGRGLSLVKTYSWLVVIGVGQWLGYVLFGFAADAFGRRRTYFAYLIVAAILAPIYGFVHSPLWLLVLGPFGGFLASDFFPASVPLHRNVPHGDSRDRNGFNYNVGRGISAVAPVAVGALAVRFGSGIRSSCWEALICRRPADAGAARNQGQTTRLIAYRSISMPSSVVFASGVRVAFLEAALAESSNRSASSNRRFPAFVE